MGRRLLLLVDGLLLVLAAVLGHSLYEAWTAVPPPAPADTGAARATEPTPPPDAPAARPPLATYGVVAERNLFSPTRSEVVPEPPRAATATAAAPTAPPPPRPRLHGVVLLPDGHGRAYLEDVQRRRVFAYAVGDSVAGARLEQIKSDRVVLRRGTDTFEVLLHDPTKPRPAAAPPGVQSPRGQPPRPGAARPPAVGVTPGGPPARLPVRPRPPAVPPGAPAEAPAESPPPDDQQPNADEE